MGKFTWRKKKVANSLNFFKRKIKSWIYLFIYLFAIYLFCFLFLFIYLFCCLFHCCSNFSSTSHIKDRMNEWIFNLGVYVVDINKSTVNSSSSSHQLINFSQRNILFFCSIGKKYIPCRHTTSFDIVPRRVAVETTSCVYGVCVYKTKQKLAHQLINIRWFSFWYTPFSKFWLVNCLSILLKIAFVYRR